MSFQFMGAFRQREGDKDGLSKYLRMLRATYGGILAGTVWLMFQSAGKVGYMGSPLEEALVGVLLFSIMGFLFCSCSTQFSRVRYRSLPIVVLVLIVAEATTVLGWWNLEAMLVWWRTGVLLLVATWLLLQACEKAVQFVRWKPGRARTRS